MLCRQNQGELGHEADSLRGGARTLAEAPSLRIYHMCDSYVIVDKPADCRIDGDFDVTVEKLVHRELAARRATAADQSASPGTAPESEPGRLAADADATRERVHIRFAHRLDFATSGLLCMAFSRAAAAAAGKLFRERRVTKHYVAMVWGTMPKCPPCACGGGGGSDGVGGGGTSGGTGGGGSGAPAARFKSCNAALFGHNPDAEQQRPKKRAQEPPPRGADGKRVRGRRAGSNFFEQEVKRLRALEGSSDGGQGQVLSVAQRQLLELTWRQVKRDPVLARPFLAAQRDDAERYKKEVAAAARAAASTLAPAAPAAAAAPAPAPQASSQQEPSEADSGCYVFDAPIADALSAPSAQPNDGDGAEQGAVAASKASKASKAIKANKVKSFSMAIGTPANPGRKALTQALVLRHGKYQGAPVSLLRLCLHTGRRHQIRLHLMHAGFPIVGDATYGDATADEHVPRMMLHSQVLQLPLSPEQPLNFETENPFVAMVD